MSERKKKSRASSADITQNREQTTRTFSDNFNDFYLALCEEYDVSPRPKLLLAPNVPPEFTQKQRKDSKQEMRASKSRTSDQRRIWGLHILRKIKSRNELFAPPMIYVTYERSKELVNPEKLECRGHVMSVCLLDALSVSVEKFRTLTTIRFPNCRINAYGISQISKILKDVGCVRDLNLDMNPNIQENYYLLCAPSGKLEYLSLKYCSMSDAGVEKISNELKYKSNELAKLIGLNIANNCITDRGAQTIGQMLHTNRSLQSLVLSANRITDLGAGFIIQELCMYPLTHEEIVDLRRLNFARLLLNPKKKSQETISSHSRISIVSSRISSAKKTAKTSKIKRNVSRKELPEEKEEISSVGEKLPDSMLLHPFATETRHTKGQVIARGNFQLQHLNLSYNHLTDDSLKKIVECLFYQNYALLDDTSKGLLYVVLEGNDYKVEGNENMEQIRDYLRNRRSPPHYEKND